MARSHWLRGGVYFLFAGIIALGAVLLAPEAAFAQVSENPPSPLLPASPNAGAVAWLFWLIFWMSVVVFILVEVLIITVVLRFRRRRADELPVQVHGNTRLEIAWTVGPALITLAVGWLSWDVMWKDLAPTAQGVSPIAVASLCFAEDVSAEEASAFLETSTLTVDITGNQWWWKLDYPDYGISTATDLYVPVGEIVSLRMSSRDVVHSWWVPQLGGKTDVYPGATTYLWFQVSEPGIYEGHCAEMCGDAHAYMPMRVVALPPAEFEQWAQNYLGEPVEPSTELAQQGAELMATKGCLGCHAVGGDAASGASRVGPALTNMGSRLQIAGLLDNNPENMRAWLADPAAIKPGARMPNLNLSDDELDALTAYLGTLQVTSDPAPTGAIQ